MHVHVHEPGYDPAAPGINDLGAGRQVLRSFGKQGAYASLFDQDRGTPNRRTTVQIRNGDPDDGQGVRSVRVHRLGAQGRHHQAQGEQRRTSMTGYRQSGLQANT